MDAETPFRLNLLGAPGLSRGGTELRLTVRKSLALLAVVALERRVSRTRLAALFWSDVDANAARRNLRRELHRLREAGLSAALLADDAMVELSPRLRCDVADFLAALDEGRDADALAAYGGALMQGFDLAGGGEFDDWLAQQRETLARRCGDAARRQAGRFEAAGDARAALALYARLVALEPLQESHYADAMRLHQLIGERAQALEQYERLRQVLRRELDLDPLPETAALAERVRAAERMAPLVSRPGSRGLVRLEAGLIGREDELARLSAAAAAVVLIEGEAGVGKTRLATECVLERQPCLRMSGRQLSRGAALHPLAETLRAALADPALRACLHALPDPTRSEVARLLPELRDGSSASGSSAGDAGTAARARFFDALVDTLAALLAGGGLLVDDLHWLDDSTLEVVEALALRTARRAEPRPRIVATARSAEMADQPGIADAVRRLERGGQLLRLPLAPLDDGGTLALVRALAGDSGDGAQGFAVRLQRLTHGNPYYLLETLRFLLDAGELLIDEAGAWSTRHHGDSDVDADLPLPPSVQQAVVERVERLGPSARRVLETAALAGDPFTLDDLQPATALGEWDALEGLERALQAQLVVPADSGYRYVHDLARHALDSAMRPERKRLIHQRLAQSLEARHGAPGRIAGHLEAAGRVDAAVPCRLAAARAAEAVFAWREALDHLQAAARSQDEAARLDTHRQRLRLLRLLHDLPGEAAALDAIEALGRALALPAVLAEVLCGRATLGIRMQHYVDALSASEAALQHPALDQAPAALRERLPLDHAFALVERARYHEAHAIYMHELAGAEGRSALFLGELHHGLANYHTSFARDAPAREHLRIAVQHFRDGGDLQRELRSLNILAYTEFNLGDTTRAIEMMNAALAQAERLNFVSTLRNTLTNFIAYLLPAGQIERAQQVHVRAMQLLAFADDAATRARLLIRQGEICTHTGDIGAALVATGAAIELIEKNSGGFPDFWAWHMRSRLLWWCGDFATPAALYLALRDSPAYLPTLEAPIRLFARAFALDGDPARAAVTAQALAELEPAPGALCYAETIAFWRAMALLQADQPEAALDLLEPAAVPLQPPPFGEHRARYLALRLAARTALAQPVEALRAETLALLPIAPAPVALELLAAWCAAAPDEPDWRRSAGALARRMQDSLADQPLLQQRYGRRWAELLAGTDGAVQSSPNDGSSASGSATTASASQSAGAAPGPR